MTKWLKKYIMFVLRIGKTVQGRTGDILYDFYGDKHFVEQVINENLLSGEELLCEASALLEDLPRQGFETHRAAYLAKQLTALETLCNRLCGVRLSLREEAKCYFELDVEWIQESVFEEAFALCDKALPGKGDIRERIAKHRKGYVLPKDKSYLLPGLLHSAVKETRERTKQIIELNNEDKIDIRSITDKPVKAMAQYLGNYHSAIIINTDIPFYIPELLSVVSHEGYPGHLAEIGLKEEYLIRKKGYFEQQVGFLLTPPFVISEGIALLAMQSIFAPGAAEQWMSEQIYPVLGIDGDTTDLLSMQKATDLFRGAWCNAALLMDEGRSVSEAVNYIMRYTLCNEEQAHNAIKSLQRPYCEAYIFTYYYGRKLLEPSLFSPLRRDKLRQLLTEQITLSDL